MMRIAPLAMVLAGAVALTGFSAEACSCVAPPKGRAGARARFDAADAVFRGRVVKVEGPSLSKRTVEGDAVRVTFAVSKAWKGSSSGLIEIATSSQEAACGLEAQEGVEYLVFANWTTEDENYAAPLAAHACNGTQRVEFFEQAAPEWLALLSDIPDLHQRRDLQKLHGRGCASCSATGELATVVPLLVLASIVRRRRARQMRSRSAAE